MTLIEETIDLLRKAQSNINIIEGSSGYIMGDAITEVIEALEFEDDSIPDTEI